MKPPRILHCVSLLDLGGAERVAWAIASGLQGEFAFGMHAIRGTADTGFGRSLEAEILARGMPLTRGPRVPMRRGGIITGAWSLLRAMRLQRPDLIHVHTEIPESSLAFARLVSSRLRDTPCVRTIHNSRIWYFAPRLGAFCEKRLADASAVGVSESALNALRASRATAGLGPDATRERLITNGIAAPRINRPPRPPGIVRFVYGGRFEQEKGADLLPDIVSKVRIPDGMRASLDIFGQGTFEPRLRALAADPPPGWLVSVHPPTPDFAARLARYDVAILPSRFEGLSLFGIEALMAGLTVVATDAQGLREVLPEGYPLQVRIDDTRAFADAMSSLLAQPDRFDATVAAARERAQELFGLERMLAGYRALYHSLLDAPRAP